MICSLAPRIQPRGEKWTSTKSDVKSNTCASRSGATARKSSSSDGRGYPRPHLNSSLEGCTPKSTTFGAQRDRPKKEQPAERRVVRSDIPKRHNHNAKDNLPPRCLGQDPRHRCAEGWGATSTSRQSSWRSTNTRKRRRVSGDFSRIRRTQLAALGKVGTFLDRTACREVVVFYRSRNHFARRGTA